MKKNLLLLVMIVCMGQLTAQVTPTEWYFGDQACLRFAPDGSTSASHSGNLLLNCFENTTTVCDGDGNVAFYAVGTKIYDNLNELNVQLLGDPSATQGAQAVPIPGDFGPTEYRFLLFSLKSVENPDVPNFSVCFVRVTKVPGNPPTYIVEPDQPGFINNVRMTEKLTYTPDGGTPVGYWVLVHDYSDADLSNTFYKYHITNDMFGCVNNTAEAIAKLQVVEQTQSTGTNHAVSTGNINNGQGQMKFNSAGNRLGLVIGGTGRCEIFTFNKTNGMLSTTALFSFANYPSNGYMYGFEFSPDGQNFYTAEGGLNGSPGNVRYISEYRINGPNLIGPYRVATDNTNNNYAFMALQLGPNDKIYCCHCVNGYSNDYVSVINSPNVYGSGCNFTQDAFIGNWAHYGLSASVTFGPTSPPPPPPAGPCTCTINSSASPILEVVRVNGTAKIKLNLNSGDLKAIAVSAEILNFDVRPFGNDCRNYCEMTTMSMGMFVEPVPPLLSYPGKLTPLQVGGTVANSHEIYWDLKNNPQQIIDQPVLLNLRFPLMYGLDCCLTQYFATIRVSFYDSDCRLCQKTLFVQSDPVK